MAIYGELEIHPGQPHQVSTANFTNPGAPLEIFERIEGFMKEEGISNLNQLIGAGRC